MNGLISLIKNRKRYDSKRILYSLFWRLLLRPIGRETNKWKSTEHTLDLAKETAQTCIEQQIAYSVFNEKQKQVMKENVHEWADTVMQGFKKRLRESGRLIESWWCASRQTIATLLRQPSSAAPCGHRLRWRYQNSGGGYSVASYILSFLRKERLGEKGGALLAGETER